MTKAVLKAEWQEQVDKLKLAAWALKKATPGLSHNAALRQTAVSAGFSSWEDLMFKAKEASK